MAAGLIDILMSDEETLSELSSEEDLFASSSSSSSESEQDNHVHAKVENFLNVIEEYSDCDFKKHFRVRRQTACILIERYGSTDFHTNTVEKGFTKIGANKAIYMFLWYMGNTNTFRELGNLFGVSKSSAWKTVKRVSEWLIRIGHEYVKWPNQNEAVRNGDAFERISEIPNIIGCIDGSHIRIKAPVNHKECYFNRKHYYSLILQAVVDAEKKFINIFCGEPESLHDSRVLRRSELYRNALNGKRQMFPNGKFILGDSAYPCLNWLIPPFKNNGSLTISQQQFNRQHSSARVVVENAFGLLKMRFGRLLHFTEQIHINMVH